MSQHKPLDSYQKLAADVFRNHGEVFKHVFGGDKDEIRCNFARFVAEADRPQNLQVFPLHASDQFKEAFENQPYQAFSLQLKAKSGRIYCVGFNFGAPIAS